MLVAGIDIGSGTTKCVVVDETGAVRGRALSRTKADFVRVSADVLAGAAAGAVAGCGMWAAHFIAMLAFAQGIPIDHDVGLTVLSLAAVMATTGLGRYAVSFRDIQITDLTCGARGAAALFPATRYVLDIGAQCSRAIKLREGGKVKEFHMNEKCAAGSGGFLERAAKYLEVAVTDIGALSLRAEAPQAISSVCAVLAESEIINHVSEGVGVENILRGIHNSLADRALSLLKRVGLDGEVTLIGGVAQQAGMVAALRDKLAVPVNVPPVPELTSALGAALLGLQRFRKLGAGAAPAGGGGDDAREDPRARPRALGPAGGDAHRRAADGPDAQGVLEHPLRHRGPAPALDVVGGRGGRLSVPLRTSPGHRPRLI